MTPTKHPYNATRLTGTTYVVPGLTNAGFIDGLVIDTCDDEAPYALTSVDRLVITHGHADHFAIGHTLRDAGADVHVARDDASLVENPDINIRGMFSWAKPGDMLVTKLFQGVPCQVDGYLEDLQDERVTVISLPGHTLGHCGFLTADGVLFTGDGLYLKDLWEKHPLPYAIDPGLVAESLKTIAKTECSWIVPGHGRPVCGDEAQSHVEFHLQQIDEIEALIVDRLKEPMTTEQTVAMVSAERGLSQNAAAYWLAVTTVKGFLGGLLDKGELDFFVQDHAGWWRSVS